MALAAPPMSGAIAALTLVGATIMALAGTIDGSDAVTLYGIVLGYVFGFRVGSVNNKNKPS